MIFLHKNLYVIICLFFTQSYFNAWAMEARHPDLMHTIAEKPKISLTDPLNLVSKSGQQHPLSLELTTLIKQNSIRAKPITIDNNAISLDISDENMGIIISFLEEIKENFHNFITTPTTKTRYNFLKETQLIKQLLSKKKVCNIYE